MRAKLANLNNGAAMFLSHAAFNLCWYYYIQKRGYKSLYYTQYKHYAIPGYSANRSRDNERC